MFSQVECVVGPGRAHTSSLARAVFTWHPLSLPGVAARLPWLQVPRRLGATAPANTETGPAEKWSVGLGWQSSAAKQ